VKHPRGAPLLAGVPLVSDQASPSSRGPLEGITVHGHWTIVVRNADGSIVSRQEFENALITTSLPGGESGGSLLSAVVLSLS